MKRLVALWNDLPGVLPVQKFTNREIALERIGYKLLLFLCAGERVYRLKG